MNSVEVVFTASYKDFMILDHTLENVEGFESSNRDGNTATFYFTRKRDVPKPMRKYIVESPKEIVVEENPYLQIVNLLMPKINEHVGNRGRGDYYA